MESIRLPEAVILYLMSHKKFDELPSSKFELSL